MTKEPKGTIYRRVMQQQNIWKCDACGHILSWLPAEKSPLETGVTECQGCGRPILQEEK